jgi:hypothetical protein
MDPSSPGALEPRTGSFAGELAIRTERERRNEEFSDASIGFVIDGVATMELS